MKLMVLIRFPSIKLNHTILRSYHRKVYYYVQTSALEVIIKSDT